MWLQKTRSQRSFRADDRVQQVIGIKTNHIDGDVAGMKPVPIEPVYSVHGESDQSPRPDHGRDAARHIAEGRGLRRHYDKVLYAEVTGVRAC